MTADRQKSGFNSVSNWQHCSALFPFSVAEVFSDSPKMQRYIKMTGSTNPVIVPLGSIVFPVFIAFCESLKIGNMNQFQLDIVCLKLLWESKQKM